MNKWLALLGVAAWAGSVSAGSALANDQEFVIGLGVGIHTFSETDDVRQGSGTFADNSDEITQAGMVQLYGEWYLLNEVGFGLRFISLNGGRTYSSSVAELKQEVNINARFITVHWVPLGSEDYVRMGVMGGLGAASYEAKETFSDSTGQFGGDFEESESTTGSASLAGIYVDWGAEGFGARFGVNVISTNLDPIEIAGEELEVDGSGAAWYFDLRWAFE